MKRSGRYLFDFRARFSFPRKTSHVALRHRLDSMGHESDETCSTWCPHRRIHDAIVASCSYGIGKPITSRVALGRIGVQAIRSWVDPANVDKIPNKARKHLCILNNGIEVADIREFALHMKRHFCNARFND